MKLSTYKSLLCKLDEQIYKESQTLCRSEIYGYKDCKDKLQKLIQVKELLQKNFNLKELHSIYAKSCNLNNNTKFVQRFNKIIGNKIELLNKKIFTTTTNSKFFNFKLPTFPILNGFFIYHLWIDCKIENKQDINYVLNLLECNKLLGFFNFKYDSINNEIYSNDSFEIIEEFSYEYVEFDVLNTLQCLNEKSIIRLIENYS